MISFLFAFWKPIAIGVTLIALVGFVGIEKHRYDESRREEGRAEIRPQVVAAQKALADSQQAEKDREAELKAARYAAKQQNAAIADAEARAKAAQQASAAIIAKAQAAAKANDARIKELQSYAAAVPRAMTCEATLRAADQIARDAARERRK